ncbi:DUF416 family protein [Micromonospora sp. M61]|uniref:DUF416 family protein n=1 Tax=Micromonospora sp. M61 TaxID=2824890 RepID=UPI001B397F72|nr:DUF416 family protein [Micromonospora sp. M61]MBQ0981179.1 DUF416 family protein [Micromonospora sp. M61]
MSKETEPSCRPEAGAASTESFDGQRLRTVLAALEPWQRVAFAVSCVEVLVPSYVKFSEPDQIGDADLVRASVDAVWSASAGHQPAVHCPELPSPDAVKELLPSEDDWNDWAPQAEDAVASLIYLLELVGSDDVTYAVYAAERAYAAADELSAREQGLGVLDADDREALLGSPSVQVELRRQAEALTILGDSAGDRSAVAELRAAARRIPVGGVRQLPWDDGVLNGDTDAPCQTLGSFSAAS